jgi:hypothetical protein
MKIHLNVDIDMTPDQVAHYVLMAGLPTTVEPSWMLANTVTSAVKAHVESLVSDSIIGATSAYITVSHGEARQSL